MHIYLSENDSIQIKDNILYLHILSLDLILNK